MRAFLRISPASTSDHVDSGKLKETLDKDLAEVNDDYRSERKGVLQIELEIIPRDIFYAWQKQQTQKAAGIGQVKVPRVLNKAMHAQWREFLEKHGTY